MNTTESQNLCREADARSNEEWQTVELDSTVLKGQSVFCYNSREVKKITLEDAEAMGKFVDHTSRDGAEGKSLGKERWETGLD